MKNSIITLTLMLAGFTIARSQTLITKLSFPDGIINTNTNAGSAINYNTHIFTLGGTSAININTSGSQGNPDRSASASGWENGNENKAWIIQLSTKCITNLTLSSIQSSDDMNPGPGDFKAQYKINSAGTWTDIPGATSINVLNDWTTGILNNVSLPSICDNQDSLFIRWIMTSDLNSMRDIVTSNGISRIDDISVSGIATCTPFIKDTVIFNNNYEVYGKDTIENLIVGSGGLVTINDMQYITGSLLLKGTLNTNAMLTLVSTEPKTASLLQEGNAMINGNVFIQRFIFGMGNFSYITSPVNLANKSVLNSPALIYDYVNPIGWEILTNTDFTMNPGKGFAVKYLNSPVINFEGIPNSGDISVPVSQGTYNIKLLYPPYTVLPYINYNLIGNPYPGAIDIKEFLLENMDKLQNATIWVWDDIDATDVIHDYSDYATFNIIGHTKGENNPQKYSGHDYLSSCQGFFLQTAAGVESIDFNDKMRVSSNNTIFKSNKSDSVQRFYMSLTQFDDALYNEILIAFKKDASVGMDKLYDSPKYIGTSQIVLYSLLEGQPFAIQTLPLLTQQYDVPLGIEIAIPGELKLSFESFENIDTAQTNIYLEDKLLNNMIDMKKIPVYNFNIAAPGIYSDRFILHFIPLETAISENNKIVSFCNIYSNGSGIFVDYKDPANKAALLSFYNLAGQNINNISLVNGFYKYLLNVNPGIYFAKIVSENKTYTRKLYVH